MIVAVVTPWFSANMGYAENKLPPALARHGCEVHLISSDLQIYATNPELYKIYEPVLGPRQVAAGIYPGEGYTLHRLPNYLTRDGVGVKGLEDLFRKIKPQVVYLFEVNTEQTLQVVALKKEFGYKVFTESRLHLSVYRPPVGLRQRVNHYFKEWWRWMIIGREVEKYYPVAPDVQHVICTYFGASPRKCELSSLAVDTDEFRPLSSQEEKVARKDLRTRLGFLDTDVVCIYTGRFSADKGPLILAKAIGLLHSRGLTKFKGLFVGRGEEEYSKQLKAEKGNYLHPFVTASELPGFYQSADLGVWPREESTSQLDAVACGLPLIISSSVYDKDRISGNGLAYQDQDFEDLAAKISSLESPELRESLGRVGAQKIKAKYSWNFMAETRIRDFRKALG